MRTRERTYVQGRHPHGELLNRRLQIACVFCARANEYRPVHPSGAATDIVVTLGSASRVLPESPQTHKFRGLMQLTCYPVDKSMEIWKPHRPIAYKLATSVSHRQEKATSREAIVPIDIADLLSIQLLQSYCA